MYSENFEKKYMEYIKKTDLFTTESFARLPYKESKLYGTITGPISDGKFRQYTMAEFQEMLLETYFTKMWWDKDDGGSVDYVMMDKQGKMGRYSATTPKSLNSLRDIILQRQETAKHWFQCKDEKDRQQCEMMVDQLDGMIKATLL